MYTTSKNVRNHDTGAFGETFERDLKALLLGETEAEAQARPEWAQPEEPEDDWGTWGDYWTDYVHYPEEPWTRGLEIITQAMWEDYIKACHEAEEEYLEEEHQARVRLRAYAKDLLAKGINPCKDDLFSDLYKDLNWVRPRYSYEEAQAIWG